LHATRSGLEGSSRSGDIVCRGVAGGVASITHREPSLALSVEHTLHCAAMDLVHRGFFSSAIYAPGIKRRPTCRAHHIHAGGVGAGFKAADGFGVKTGSFAQFSLSKPRGLAVAPDGWIQT